MNKTQTNQTETHPQCNKVNCPEHPQVNIRLAKAIFGDSNQTDSGNAPSNEEAKRLASFGMFGNNFDESKKMIREQLKRHGLTLKVKTNHHSDNVEIWIERL